MLSTKVKIFFSQGFFWDKISQKTKYSHFFYSPEDSPMVTPASCQINKANSLKGDIIIMTEVD